MQHMKTLLLAAAPQRCRDVQKTRVAGDYGLFMRHPASRNDYRAARLDQETGVDVEEFSV
jgi:hypothetical protein